MVQRPENIKTNWRVVEECLSCKKTTGIRRLRNLRLTQLFTIDVSFDGLTIFKQFPQWIGPRRFATIPPKNTTRLSSNYNRILVWNFKAHPAITTFDVARDSQMKPPFRHTLLRNPKKAHIEGFQKEVPICAFHRLIHF